ncbi:LysE family translocator [Rhizobium sp. Root482]|uniref:LysE family translocator n=1 Tax=Rhizobium sp. Root482 TaxID=1736543 RepID=UPI0007017E16|nr:LysE family translocator [Rhizobium sp. Root482]KQY13252.1 lysine transporter LysE [Rhizobium sp. Root482]
MTIEYLITSIIVILLPGTGVLYTLAVGLNAGTRASILAALGCTLGILPHIIASIAGLAALLHASALAFQVIKYLGVAYLIYMAWNVLRNAEAFAIAESQPPVPALRVIATGVLLNTLNPKLSLFFLAFLPQFVPAATPSPTPFMLALALVFMALTFIVFVLYGVFASVARRHVIAKPGVTIWLRRGFAGAFGLMGLRLALSAR